MESRVSLFERLVEEVLELMEDKLSESLSVNDSLSAKSLIKYKSKQALDLLADDSREGEIFWLCNKPHDFERFMKILLAHVYHQVDETQLAMAKRIQQLVQHETNYEKRNRLKLAQFYFLTAVHVPFDSACHPDDFPKRVESLSVFSRFQNPRNRRVRF